MDTTYKTDARLWWMCVSLFIIGLLVASVLVVLRGSNRPLKADSVMPEPNSVVSVQPIIRALFGEAMNKESLEGKVSISPDLPFELAWGNNGYQLRILPREPMSPETDYTITIGPGISNRNGIELQGELEWSFQTRQPRIAYTRFADNGLTELWMSDFRGENQLRLSGPEQFTLDFDASPDGSTVVYTVQEEEGAVNLWRTATDGGGMTRLTEDEGVIYNAPRFNPTGDLFAVESREEVQIGDQGSRLSPPRIELRRPIDGSPAGDIYGGQGNFAHSPRWSPNGTHIAFFEANASALGIFNFTSEILFFPAESLQIGRQSWSPNERAIVYTAIYFLENKVQQNIVLRDIELGTQIVLGEESGDQSSPAWSPDGTALAYVYKPAPNSRENEGVWLMQPNGQSKVQLLSEPNVSYSDLLWSPDSEWLLFGRFVLQDQNATQSVWVMRRDGRDLRQIADYGVLFTWVP